MWGLAVFLSAQAAVCGSHGGIRAMEAGERGYSRGSWSETTVGVCRGRKGGADEHTEQVRGGSPSSGDFRVKIRR